MVSRTERTGTRRSFLAVTGAAVVGGALATGTASAADAASFHLTQGKKCIPRRYDRWQTNDTTATIDWTWDGGRADGGVYGPLGDDTDIRIDPAFNERAALYGKHYDGTIDDWQALSGDRSNPTRTSLDRSTPVRIESGACPSGASGTKTGETPATQGTSTAQGSSTTTRSRANGTAGSTPNGTTPVSKGTPTTSADGSPGTGGSDGELQRLLDEFSRILDRLSHVLDRAARFIDQILRSVGRHL